MWRRRLIASISSLQSAYGSEILKSYEAYLAFLEEYMSPHFYDEAANALVELNTVAGGEILCRKWTERWHDVMRRRRNLLAIMKEHGL